MTMCKDFGVIEDLRGMPQLREAARRLSGCTNTDRGDAVKADTVIKN